MKINGGYTNMTIAAWRHIKKTVIHSRRAIRARGEKVLHHNFLHPDFRSVPLSEDAFLKYSGKKSIDDRRGLTDPDGMLDVEDLIFDLMVELDMAMCIIREMEKENGNIYKGMQATYEEYSRRAITKTE
jgi:hypothetical protein